MSVRFVKTSQKSTSAACALSKGAVGKTDVKFYLAHNSLIKEHLADTRLYMSESLGLGGSAGVAFPSMELKAMTPFRCCVTVMLSHRARTYNTSKSCR